MCCASSAPFQRCRSENQRIPLVALWAFEGPIFETVIGLGHANELHLNCALSALGHRPTYSDALLESCVWLLCVTSASGSHCHAKGGGLLSPLGTIPLVLLRYSPTRGAFFCHQSSGNRQHREAVDAANTVTILKGLN
jgi:hypothetical protein